MARARPPPQKPREAPEELLDEREKVADNDPGAKTTSWQTQYQRLKIEVSEGTNARPDARMVRSRRSTLPYGDCEDDAMIEDRSVYESTNEVSEYAGGSSGGVYFRFLLWRRKYF